MRLLALADKLMAMWRGLAARRPKQARGVLLLSAGGLGDTILFSLLLPRFRTLAEGGEPVTVLLRKDAAKMAFVFGPDVRVETVDFKRLRKDKPYRYQTFDGLYQAHYRLVISTDFLRHPYLDEALIFAADAPQTMAMTPRAWPKYQPALDENAKRYGRLFDSGPDRVDKVLRFSRFADWLTDTTKTPPVVRIAEDQLAPALQTDKSIVVIQPFSAVAAKQSPVQLYQNLIDALPADTDVVIAGAPGDLDVNPHYRTLLDTHNVRMDTSTFEAVVPLLRAAKLVVSVDTAMMHLAVAVGAPTLCLASAAYEGEIVPYAPEVTPDNMTVYYKTRDCAGCLGDCKHPLQEGMYPCVADLDAGEAIGQALRILDGASQK